MADDVWGGVDGAVDEAVVELEGDAPAWYGGLGVEELEGGVVIAVARWRVSRVGSEWSGITYNWPFATTPLTVPWAETAVKRARKVALV